jgi:hypothetical protein
VILDHVPVPEKDQKVGRLATRSVGRKLKKSVLISDLSKNPMPRGASDEVWWLYPRDYPRLNPNQLARERQDAPPRVYMALNRALYVVHLMSLPSLYQVSILIHVLPLHRFPMPRLPSYLLFTE